MGRVTVRRSVVRIDEGEAAERADALAAEEPMEIRVGGKALAVTMRTPGNDFDLAAGFLVSEGVVRGPDDIVGMRYCAGATAEGVNTYNVVDVVLASGVPAPDPSVQRMFYTSSSCGLCGKASLDAVRTTATWPVADDPLRMDATTISSFPGRLRAAQKVFDSTGGLHAAGIFSSAGELLCVREDIGRHNAVDKVIGHALLEGLLPACGTALMVSGRASFELVQKALMAGVPLLAAVSAPSSLAAELAADNGMTLVGFVRGSSMNVYAGSERVVHAESLAR